MKLKFTKSQKKVLHTIYHFAKYFMIGTGEGFFVGEFAKRGKTNKSKILRLVIGNLILLPVNYDVVAQIETKNWADRLDEVEDEDTEN